MRRANSQYVCMVCLREIVLKKTRSDSLGKRSVFDVSFNFLKFVRGGTSGGPKHAY